MIYEELDLDALRESLAQQQDLFEEVTEERMIILGQENLHLSSKLVVKYQNELEEIKASITKLENIIAQKQV